MYKAGTSITDWIFLVVTKTLCCQEGGGRGRGKKKCSRWVSFNRKTLV